MTIENIFIISGAIFREVDDLRLIRKVLYQSLFYRCILIFKLNKNFFFFKKISMWF